MKLARIYTWLRHPGESLSQRGVHAGFWAFTLRITNRLLGLTRTIILARVLAPNDFGLYGIALLSLSTLETFSQAGLDQALIQKQEDTRPYLDTAWTVQVIRGLVLAIFLVLGAPLVGKFFGEPRAVPLVRVLGAAFFLKSLGNIGILYFQKELKFHKLFIYEFSGTLADLAVAIPAALLLRSVWALVFGLLAGNLVRMVMSYLVHPYRPQLAFDQEQFKELFGFGKWIFGSSVIIFLLTQGDDILVGRVIGVAALGFYQMAYRLSNLPATEITHVVSRVTFPIYSNLQNNLPKLREAYLKILQVTAFVSIPLAGGIFILAPDFTKIFLGENWMSMVPAMQVLTIFGVTRSINATFGSFFQGIGKPRILTETSAIQLIILMILIYPFTTKWGILGTSLAVLIPNFLVCMYLSKKLIINMSLKFSSYLKNLFIPATGTAIMIFLIATIKSLGEVNLSIFLFSIVSGIVLYLGVIALMTKLFAYSLFDNMKHVLKGARQ